MTTLKYWAVALVLGLAAPAMAEDFSGFYGGLALSRTDGTDNSFYFGALDDSNEMSGTQPGVFLGYNVRNGNFVYGGELAYGGGNIPYKRGFSSTSTPASANFLDGMIDVKGRVGYVSGRALWFGSLGWAVSDRTFGGPVTNDPLRSEGVSLGLGVDVMVGERVFIGAEIQRRRLELSEGELGGFPNDSIEHDLTSVTLRIGMSF